MMMPMSALGSGADALAGGAEGRFQRLWVHEVMRVFYDRLVDEADQEWLLEQVGGRGLRSDHTQHASRDSSVSRHVFSSALP